MVDLGPSRANSWCCDPVFCVHCGRVGHNVQNCQVKRDMMWSGQDQEEQFGEWMRASSLQMLGLEPTQPMDPIQNKLPSRLPIPQQTPVLQDVQKNQVSSPAILSFSEQQLPKDTCAATTSHNHLSISPTELTSTQSSHNQETSSPLGSPVGLNFPNPSKLHPSSLSSDPTPVPVIQPTTRPNLHNVVNPGPKQHTSAAPDNHTEDQEVGLMELDHLPQLPSSSLQRCAQKSEVSDIVKMSTAEGSMSSETQLVAVPIWSLSERQSLQGLHVLDTTLKESNVLHQTAGRKGTCVPRCEGWELRGCPSSNTRSHQIHYVGMSATESIQNPATDCRR